MTAYSNSTLAKKLKACIDIVRKDLGEPTNKLTRYSLNGQAEKDKFYVVSKDRKLVQIRNRISVSKEDLLASVLELKSGNCGEYGLYTAFLLQLKGFETYTCVEDYGDDNHCYSIIKFDGYYWSIDSWKRSVVKLGRNLPTANNAVCTQDRKEKKPLQTNYWDGNLYDNQVRTAVGKSNALAKLKKLNKVWK